MRQINLLPRELAARRQSRRILAGIVAGGAAVVVALGVVYAAQQARLSGEKRKLEDVQADNARIRRSVAQLQQFSTQQQDLATKEALLVALTRNEVLWSSVLTEVSLVIPPDDWLTSFTGNVQAAAAAAPAPGVAPSVGSITVAGCTLIPPDGDHLNVAQFLIQIAKPLSFADDPLLTVSNKGDDENCPVNFSAQIQLTDAAKRSAQGKDRKI